MNNGTIAVFNEYLAFDGFTITNYSGGIPGVTILSHDLPLTGSNDDLAVHLQIITPEDVLSSTSLGQEILPELFDFKRLSLTYLGEPNENGDRAGSFALLGDINTIESIEVEQPPEALTFTNSLNIGNYGYEGSFSYDGTTGVYDLQSGGAALGRWEDWFHFVYEEVSGDVDFSARIPYISEGWSSAGIMIRDDLTTYSKQTSSLITLYNGGRFSIRKEPATPYPDVDVPALTEGSWLRLVKQGNQVSNYISSDGETWTLVGTETVDFGESFYIGLIGVAEGSGPATNIIVDEVNIELQ